MTLNQCVECTSGPSQANTHTHTHTCPNSNCLHDKPYVQIVRDLLQAFFKGTVQDDRCAALMQTALKNAADGPPSRHTGRPPSSGQSSNVSETNIVDNADIVHFHRGCMFHSAKPTTTWPSYFNLAHASLCATRGGGKEKNFGPHCHVHTIQIRIPQWNCQGYTLDSIYLGSTGAYQAVPSNLGRDIPVATK